MGASDHSVRKKTQPLRHVTPSVQLLLCTKRTSFRPDVIERQLAHAVRDPLGRAHNRTAHFAERRRMMTVWADYLDKLRASVKVIPLRANQSLSA